MVTVAVAVLLWQAPPLPTLLLLITGVSDLRATLFFLSLRSALTKLHLVLTSTIIFF